MSDKDIEEIQKFGEEVGLSKDAEGLDSPYALLIRNVDRHEDADLIYKALSGSGVDLDLKGIKDQLEQGHVLVSHLNEAKAAAIVDQIKDIEADIRFGLLSELLPTFKKGAEAKEVKTDQEPEEFTDITSTPGESEEEEVSDIILSTAPSISGKNVKKYLGLVSTEVILKEEALLKEAEEKEGAIDYDKAIGYVQKGLLKKAKAKGAAAVIAITFDFKFLKEKQAFIIFATGTAVTF